MERSRIKRANGKKPFFATRPQTATDPFKAWFPGTPPTGVRAGLAGVAPASIHTRARVLVREIESQILSWAFASRCFAAVGGAGPEMPGARARGAREILPPLPVRPPSKAVRSHAKPPEAFRSPPKPPRAPQSLQKPPKAVKLRKIAKIAGGGPQKTPKKVPPERKCKGVP